MEFKKIDELYDLLKLRMINDEEQLNLYFQPRKPQKSCFSCNLNMTTIKRSLQKVILRCCKCYKKSTTYLIKESFYSKNIIELLEFIFYFTVNINVDSIVDLTDIKNNTVYKYLKAIQNEIVVFENSFTVPIGGYNCTVEIDEMHIGRRKNNKGRIGNQKIVFGGVCRETKEIFMKIVNSKTVNDLGREILSNILPLSTIHSDQWSAYLSFFRNNYLYHHRYVNHKYNFINPVDGTHTQSIESLWAEFKRFKRRKCYSKQTKIIYYLSEFKMRRRFAEKSKKKLFEHLIKLLFK